MITRTHVVIAATLVVLAVAVAAVQLNAQVRPQLPVRAPSTVVAQLGAGNIQLGFGGLELRIRTDKAEYNLGEPVVVYISLANRGTQTVGVLDYLEPEANYVQFLVTKPGSATAERFLPYIVECTDTGPVNLAPGETLNGAAKVFYGQQGWLFDRPGAYTLQAIYLGRVESNRLNLTVVQGAGDDRTAGRLLVRSSEAGRFLYLEGGDHLTEGRAVLQRISDQHGASALAPYANYALGVNLSEDFANFQTQSLREADLPGANRLLERSATRLPNHAYYSLGLLGQLNANHAALGNQAQVNATAAQLQTTLNALPPEMAVFSQQILLLHQVPSNLQLIVPPGARLPRHLPAPPR